MPEGQRPLRGDGQPYPSPAGGGDVAAHVHRGTGGRRGPDRELAAVVLDHRHLGGDDVGRLRAVVGDPQIFRTHGEPDDVADGDRVHRGGVDPQVGVLHDDVPSVADRGDGDVDHVAVAHEVGDVPVHRGGVHLLGGAHLLHPALAQHDEAVGHGQRLLLVVGDVHGGQAQALVEPADLGAHVEPELGVEVGHILIIRMISRTYHKP